MREIEQKLNQMMIKLMAFLFESAQNGSFGWDDWLATNGITTTPENKDEYWAVTINTAFSNKGECYARHEATTFHVPKELATKALVLGFLP